MRMIDGDKLLARYKERCAGCKETKNYCEHCCDIADVISDIEDAPTIDIVRCAECEHYQKDHYFECALHTASVKPDDFCGFGERRKDNGKDN